MKRITNGTIALAFAGLLALVIGPPAVAQQSLLPDLQVARLHYPTPMAPAQQAALLNEVAWKHRAEGWKLLLKPSGNNCPAPSGALVSCDYLVFAPSGAILAQGFDVLTDAEGAGRVTFDRGDQFQEARWSNPVESGTPTTPPAPPAPPPAPPAPTGLELRISALEASNAELSAAVIALGQEVQSAGMRMDAIEAHVIPEAFTGCKASVFGIKGNCQLTK